jgi:beta-glucosidase
MVRKLLAVCLIVILCASLMPAAAMAQETDDFQIRMDKNSLQVGDKLTVTIEGEKLIALTTYKTKVAFDPAKLEYSGTVYGEKITERILQGNTIELMNVMVSDTGISGNAELYRLEFIAKAAGNTALTLTEVEMQTHEEARTLTSRKRNINQIVAVEVLSGSLTPPPAISVTGVTIHPEAMELAAGETGQLTAAVAPANASNKNMTWFSSDPAVAAVNGSGLVTAVAAGSAAITVTTVDGGKTATSMATVTSSGGGSTTPPTPTPIPTPTPLPTPKPFAPIVKVEASTDGNGVASAVVKTEELQAAINGTNGHKVSIEVKEADGAKEIQVIIPVAAILAAKDSRINTITVDTGLAAVSINPDLLKKNDAASSDNLELSVAKVDASILPVNVQEQLGGSKTVYDFNLSLNGVKISSFDGKEVNVAIPYTLKPGENPNKVIIYYIADDGELEVIKNGKYNSETGKVEFKPKHFSKYAAGYANVSFRDVAGVEWAINSIEGLAAREAIDGEGDGRFNPGGDVTRAEFIVMLMRAFDLIDNQVKAAFADAEKGAWYYSAVASAGKLGIVDGKEDGSFGINDKISRQDMAVMIFRTAQRLNAQLPVTSASGPFADQTEIDGYAREAVSSIERTGIVDGVGGGKFAPRESSTRAQAATVIYRLFQFVD